MARKAANFSRNPKPGTAPPRRRFSCSIRREIGRLEDELTAVIRAKWRLINFSDPSEGGQKFAHSKKKLEDKECNLNKKIASLQAILAAREERFWNSRMGRAISWSVPKATPAEFPYASQAERKWIIRVLKKSRGNDLERILRTLERRFTKTENPVTELRHKVHEFEKSISQLEAKEAELRKSTMPQNDKNAARNAIEEKLNDLRSRRDSISKELIRGEIYLEGLAERMELIRGILASRKK